MPECPSLSPEVGPMTSTVPVDSAELAGDLRLTHHECRHRHLSPKLRAPQGQSQCTDVSTCQPTHCSPASEGFKKALWSLAQPTHLVWGGTESKTGGPLPTGLEGFSLWGSRVGRQRLSELGPFAEGHQPKVSEGKR